MAKACKFGLKILEIWLKTNKVALNVSKTELLIFGHPNKNINFEFKIKIDAKKLAISI